MNCSQAQDLITRVVTGNADPAAFEAHAGACPACAEACRRARQVWALMGRLPSIASASAPPRPARRTLPWITAAAGVAAAVVLAVLLVRPSAPAPRPASPDIARPAPAPTEPDAPALSVVPEPTRQQVQAETVLDTVTPADGDVIPPPPVPPAPPAPVEKAVVRVPEPPTPGPLPERPEPPVPAVVQKDSEPVAPTAPAVPDRASRPTVATLRLAEGRVVARADGVQTDAREGFRMTAGDGLETLGADSVAVLQFPDGSRLSLGADTVVTRILDRAAEGEGRRIVVRHGVIAAQIAKQDADAPWIFETPQAEARILGTRLTLLVADEATRLEVREGRVRLSRRPDGAAADVNPDQFAVASKGAAPAAKPIPGPKFALRETFDRGRWAPVWAMAADPSTGLLLSVQQGALALRCSRSADELPGGVLPTDATPEQRKALQQARAASVLGGGNREWPRAASLATRGSFAVTNDAPLRLRARLWHPGGADDRAAWIGVGGGPAGGLMLERRGRELVLLVEGADKPLWSQAVAQDSDWELLEIWLSRDRVAIRRNGLTLHAGAHPLQARALQVAVGGRAKAELEREGESRFDDLDVAWVTKREFADVAR